MKQLKYIGEHKPHGMIIAIEDKDVEKMLETGEYVELDLKKVKEKVKLINVKSEGLS